MHATFCNGKMSSFQTVNIGVPQGSVLGPLLFLLYMNDLPMHTSAQCNMFADDTLLYCLNNTLEEGLLDLQSEVNRVALWFNRNKLTLNVNKSNTMLIGSRQRLDGAASEESLGITLNGNPVTNTSVYTYLGVVLDSHIIHGIRM